MSSSHAAMPSFEMLATSIPPQAGVLRLLRVAEVAHDTVPSEDLVRPLIPVQAPKAKIVGSPVIRAISDPDALRSLAEQELVTPLALERAINDTFLGIAAGAGSEVLHAYVSLQDQRQPEPPIGSQSARAVAPLLPEAVLGVEQNTAGYADATPFGATPRLEIPKLIQSERRRSRAGRLIGGFLGMFRRLY